MEASYRRKGKYEPSTSYTEIEVSRRDTYDMLMHKSADAVGFLREEGRELALYKPGTGIKIPNEDITQQDGVKTPWTVGSYLRRARRSAQKVSFGVGFILQSKAIYTFSCAIQKCNMYIILSRLQESKEIMSGIYIILDI